MGETLKTDIKVVESSEVLDAAVVAACWRIYRTAFDPIAHRTPMVHGSYTEDAFGRILADCEFAKYLAYVGDELVGLCLITTALEKVPWINAGYYRDRYPDQYEGGRLFYLPAVVIDPDHQDWRRVGALLLTYVVRSLDEDGVLAVDYSENLRSGLALFVSRALGRSYREEILERQVFAAYSYPMRLAKSAQDKSCSDT